MDLERLQRKLDRVRELDPEYRLFGAATHRYMLQPCLDEAALQDFEKQHQIVLPQDYRQFLQHIGNGGAGPDYGMYPLHKAVISTTPNFLQRPFPYTYWWNGATSSDWSGRDLSHEEVRQIIDQTMDQNMEDPDYYSEHHLQGTLHLAHHGCGFCSFLVVSGPQHGNVWSDDRASGGGIRPPSVRVGPKRITFSAWYEWWLDMSLEKIGDTTTKKMPHE